MRIVFLFPQSRRCRGESIEGKSTFRGHQPPYSGQADSGDLEVLQRRRPGLLWCLESQYGERVIRCGLTVVLVIEE